MLTLLPMLAAACTLSPADSALVARFLAAWSFISERRLHLPAAQPPMIIVADRRCQYTLRPGDGKFLLSGVRLGIAGSPHRNTLRFPNGQHVPLSGMAFTSLYGPSSDAFFVMALPEVWRHDAKFRRDSTDWDTFVPAIGIHELTHSRQLNAMFASLEQAAKTLKVSSLDDDVLQRRWSGNADFARALLHERDLLLQAATAPADQRSELIRQALDSRNARHQRWFTGDASAWADVETRFMDLEGVAQWAALQLMLMADRDTAAAIQRVRDNKKWWSQEYGLALYLALDRVVPDWQSSVFPPQLTSAFALLEAASARR